MRAYKVNRVFYSLGVIVLGTFLLLRPEMSLTLVARCIGVFMLAGGVLTMASTLKNRTIFTGVFIVLSVLTILIGIWILSNPYRLASLIPTVIGVFVFLSGALNVGESVLVGRRGGKWISSLIMGLITVGLGVLLITRAFGIASFITRLGGAAFLYDGLTDLLITWRMKPAPNLQEPIDVESHEVIPPSPDAPAEGETPLLEHAAVPAESAAAAASAASGAETGPEPEAVPVTETAAREEEPVRDQEA